LLIVSPLVRLHGLKNQQDFFHQGCQPAFRVVHLSRLLLILAWEQLEEHHF
jgi:hypothetical protein